MIWFEAANFLAMSEEAKKYDTVIGDSFTEIQEACMDHIIANRVGTKDDSGLSTYIQPQIQDWGALGNMMVKTIKHFRDLNKNFIAIFLSEEFRNEETFETLAEPMIQPKRLREKLPAYFDEVLYLFTKERKGKDGEPEIVHVAATHETNKWVAKDRSGKLPLYVKPDFCEIYKTITGKESR